MIDAKLLTIWKNSKIDNNIENHKNRLSEINFKND
jgi:hypothetical protein